MSALRADELSLPLVKRDRDAHPSSAPATDELLSELVSKARAGDREAFGRLVRLTSPACYALALRLVGNEHDARDVVQDAYLRAFRGLRRFRGDAAFTTWLHRITVNCAANLIERRAKSRHDVLDEGVDARRLIDRAAEGAIEAAASSADERDRLAGALASLPDRLRVVVVLRDIYDLSHREIARELGISQTAAKVRLHRARRMLQERLFTPTPSRNAAPAPAPTSARAPAPTSARAPAPTSARAPAPTSARAPAPAKVGGL